MSGKLVIWSLISHNAPVLAIVPLARIREGDHVTIKTVLPSIIITSVDDNERLTVAMTEPNRMHVERVQVTPILKGTDGTPSGLGTKGVDALLALIEAACPNQRGTIAGVVVDSILPAGRGSDLSSAAESIYSRPIDFIVRWKS